MSLDALAVAKTIAAYNRQVDDLTAALRECVEALEKARLQIVQRHGQGFSKAHSSTCPTCDDLELIDNALARSRKLLKESEGSHA